MLRYLTIPKFAAESGYTEEAVRTKIQRGIWLEDVVWIKAPDNRQLIDVEGFYRWARGEQPSDPLRKPR
jgi:hypothetical protein